MQATLLGDELEKIDDDVVSSPSDENDVVEFIVND